ncbi:MAG: hypothetical protein GEU75_11725 [Dehalococcoidia bacterium]|nr:hypothetical protein [Dehalococcoidia bacterium]
MAPHKKVSLHPAARAAARSLRSKIASATARSAPGAIRSRPALDVARSASNAGALTQARARRSR